MQDNVSVSMSSKNISTVRIFSTICSDSRRGSSSNLFCRKEYSVQNLQSVRTFSTICSGSRWDSSTKLFSREGYSVQKMQSIRIFQHVSKNIPVQNIQLGSIFGTEYAVSKDILVQNILSVRVFSNMQSARIFSNMQSVRISSTKILFGKDFQYKICSQ